MSGVHVIVAFYCKNFNTIISKPTNYSTLTRLGNFMKQLLFKKKSDIAYPVQMPICQITNVLG